MPCQTAVMPGEAKQRTYNFENYHLPRVGPKQLCASALSTPKIFPRSGYFLVYSNPEFNLELTYQTMILPSDHYLCMFAIFSLQKA